MKTLDVFVNEYHKRLLRDDEDVDAVAHSIVSSFSREQCIDLLNELSDKELQQLVALLVMDQVKEFLIEEDRGNNGLFH